MKRFKLLLISFLLLILIIFSLGLYFSNQIIYQPKKSFLEYTEEHPGTPFSLDQLRIKSISFDLLVEKNIVLSGWFIPNKKKKTILLLHGLGENRLQTIKYVPFLYKNGYSICLFDFRGSGLSSAAKCSLGYLEAKDIITVVDYLEKEYLQERFGIIGISSGGVAGLFAAAKDSRIYSIVAESPYIALEEVIYFKGKEKYPYLPRFFYPITFSLASRRLGVSTKAINLLNILPHLINRAVFYIQGQKDDLMGTTYSQKLYANTPGIKKIWNPSDAGHNQAYDLHKRTYEKKVLAFFKRTL